MHQNTSVKEEGFIAVQLLRNIAYSPLWVKTKSQPCEMYKMEVEERVVSKGESIFPFPIQEVFQFISSDDQDKEIDPSLVQQKELEVISNDLKVYYERYKGTWPMSDRDFVTVGAVHREDKRIFWAYKSIAYPFAEVKNVVRGEVKVGGFILEELEEKKTRVTYVSDVDVKGKIPGMLKKKMSEDEGQLVSQLQGYMMKYYQH